VIQLELEVEGLAQDKKQMSKVKGKFNQDKDKQIKIIHTP
jgi:hypothetical protein